MASLFNWRLLGFLVVLFIAFSIATLTITLLLVEEVRKSSECMAHVDTDKLTYVQVANWIYVGVASALLMSMATSYYWIHVFNKKAGGNAGLRPAPKDSGQHRGTVTLF